MNIPLDSSLEKIALGKAEVLKRGSAAAILALGNTVHPALGAAETLEDEGIACTIINSRFVKPLDEEVICEMAHTIGTIITVEEHVLHGGFGSAVLEVLSRHQLTKAKVCCLGIPDNFVEHGAQKMLRAKYGIDADGISKAVKKIINGDYSGIAQNRKSAFG